MGKWLVTVDDLDDDNMRDLEKTTNEVWINDWAGEAVPILDMQKMED
jgi:hypothetical protein